MSRRKRRKPAPSQPLAGPPPERRAPRPKPRTSVEDPLDDWRDDEGQADRWLAERVADDVQRD
jgi:hypothetical protein